MADLNIEAERALFESSVDKSVDLLRMNGKDYTYTETRCKWEGWLLARSAVPAQASAAEVAAWRYRTKDGKYWQATTDAGIAGTMKGHANIEVRPLVDAAHPPAQGSVADVASDAETLIDICAGHEGTIYASSYLPEGTKLYATHPPAQASAAEWARLQEILESEFDAYRTVAGVIPWAINALLDNSPHRLAAHPPAQASAADEPTPAMLRAGWACMPREGEKYSGMDYVFYIYKAMRKAAHPAQGKHSAGAGLPSGYTAKHVEGHGWIIDAPKGGRWIAFDGTPIGDFMSALLASPGDGEHSSRELVCRLSAAIIAARMGQGSHGYNHDGNKLADSIRRIADDILAAANTPATEGGK